jgi:hypothetical protein
MEVLMRRTFVGIDLVSKIPNVEMGDIIKDE